MSTETSPRSSRRNVINALKNAFSIIVVVALILVGFWGSHYLAPGHTESDTHNEPISSQAEALTKITLPPEKLATADIRVSKVECTDLQRTKTVVATIDYDSTRHLTVKAPVECVAQRWLVKPGQTVAKGDRLAVLSGAEIALARTEIKKGQADLRIARMNFEWAKETQENLRELLATLKERPSMQAVESQFDTKRLGEHRDHLLSTYTKYVLASNVAARSKPLSDEGIIAGSTAEARSSNRDIASTSFKSACEQSEFEGRQAMAKSQAEWELAVQNLAVAQDRLRLLLGPLAEQAETGAPGDFEVRAPFAGRIEAVHSGPAARFAQGEPVLTLADTSNLWVSAFVHQHDWDALQVASTDDVEVTLPAFPNETFTASVSFVGPQVSATTRAISLVADLDNADGRFRPGMFAWVALPMEAKRKGLVVPTSAIQRHESSAFVFEKQGTNQFRRVDVTVGIETPEFTEITRGLSVGQAIVDRGAFFLKSELLLEQEEE